MALNIVLANMEEFLDQVEKGLPLAHLVKHHPLLPLKNFPLSIIAEHLVKGWVDL